MMSAKVLGFFAPFPLCPQIHPSPSYVDIIYMIFPYKNVDHETAWKSTTLKLDVSGATLDLILFYLKHIYLLSLLLLGRDRGRRGGRRQWRRLSDRLSGLLLDCMELELDSGVDLRDSIQWDQILERFYKVFRTNFLFSNRKWRQSYLQLSQTRLG